MDVASKSEWCFSGALSSVTALFSDKITLSVRQCQECLQPISHSAIQQKIWRSCHNICSIHFISPSSLCTSSVRVSNSSNTTNSCSWDKQINRNFQKTQPHCTWNRTLFEPNTFYNSIRLYLPSGVNDYQKKKTPWESPAHHSCALAGKAEPPQETAWKKVNKISRIISNLDTIKFHTVATSFTRL